MSFQMFQEVTTTLLGGFGISLLIFAVTLLCGVPLGLPIAFCSMSRFKPLKVVTKIFVWIIRGVPLMLQIFIIYYGAAIFAGESSKGIFVDFDMYLYKNYQININQNWGGVIAVGISFVINYACYFSEIYRGGIESISKGQYEAGYVLGMTKKQVFRKIILKQVVQRITPPMSNEIITLIKDTALANSIVVPEIVYLAKKYNGSHGLIWPLFYAGAFYLLFVGILTIVLGKTEKKLSYFRS